MTDKVKLSAKVYDSALSTAVNVLQYIDGESRQEMLDELRSQVAHYAEIEEKFKSLKEITSKFIQESKKIDQNSGDNEDPENDNEDNGGRVTIENLYKKYCERVEEIQVDTSNNNHFKHFTDQMNQLMSLDGEQETSGDNGDEMFVTGSINVICPISKKRMVEPVKNAICGHVYDKASVTEMIKSNARSRCPLMGCSNAEFLRIDHLNVDIVTRLHLERNP